MAKAAARLAVSRPVISRTIAELEQFLGVRLLDRTARGVSLNLFGESLHRRAVSVLDELRRAREDLVALADPQAGELRIASTEVWAAGLVPAAIDRLLQRFPRLRVYLEQGTADQQFQLLRDRRCEVVVSRLLTQEPEAGIGLEPLFHEPLLVVAGPDSPRLRKRGLTLAHLIDDAWILSPLETQPNSPFVKAFRTTGREPPQAAILTNSLHLRTSLLATGRYLTLVPGSALFFGPRNFPLRKLPVELPRWHFPTGLFTLKGRMLSPAAEQFVTCVRELSAAMVDYSQGRSSA